eukprot:5335764-Pyramimonas_sp.AAC.1
MTQSADVAWGLVEPIDVEEGADGEKHLLAGSQWGTPAGSDCRLNLSKIPPGTPAGDPVYLQEFRKIAVVAIKEICKTYGGCQQFLNQRFPDKNSRQDLAQKMLELYPTRDDIHYHWGKMPDGRGPFGMHISMFNFSTNASPKPPPETLTCIALVQQIVQDGFITHMDEIK